MAIADEIRRLRNLRPLVDQPRHWAEQQRPFNGPSLGHDSLLINANIAVQGTPRIWTTVGYDGQVARDNYDSYAVTGTISFSF